MDQEQHLHLHLEEHPQAGHLHYQFFGAPAPAPIQQQQQQQQSLERLPAGGQQDLLEAKQPTNQHFQHLNQNNAQNNNFLFAAASEQPGCQVRARKKKTRTMFNNYQLSMLETTFQQSPYPDGYTRRELAGRLALDEIRVQVWFQNRRAKWRKKALVPTSRQNSSASSQFQLAGLAAGSVAGATSAGAMLNMVQN